MSNRIPQQAIQPLAVSNAGTTSATATLTNAPGRTLYCTGLTITSSGATSPGTATATLTNSVGGTLSFVYPQVAIATNNQVPLELTFNPPIPSTTGNNMVASVTTGAGTTATAIVITGYMI